MDNSNPPARVFTIEEVDALIPRLNRLVGDQMSLKADIERNLQTLVQDTGEVPSSLSALPDDSDEVKRAKENLARLIVSYNRGWEDIQELGAVVKDPHIGLLDFYGRIDGKLVWLCWRFGEDRLGFYHDLDAGFAGRRSLRPDTRSKLLN